MATSVLITGGTGFLGVFIVDAIQEQHLEWSITVLDLVLPKAPKDNVAYEIGDVTDLQSVIAITDRIKPKVIIHTAGLVPELAGRYGRRLKERVWDTNVNGTRNMLSAAKKAGVEAFVWTGSCCAVTDDMRYQYPNIDETWPTSNTSLIYGESKAAAETLVLSANTPLLSTCSLRPSVLFGPGDYQLIPSIHAMIPKRETHLVIGPGSNLWDVTYAPNIADAHILAVENLLSSSKTAAGEAIFISNEQPITFRDFCLALWKEFGHIPTWEVHIPVGVANLAGWVAEWVTWVTGTPTTLSRGVCWMRLGRGIVVGRRRGGCWGISRGWGSRKV
ncbi:hypothetical protein ABVK25_002871 [Lepraria finkii]|uniref:3-beta hydroxysteroid dehydrogenase/isomerase domain-containing protein n=1 Tax=Lepraria finkii TaxID=1340010 RepID=A0ABR4BH43_9LECA